MNRQLFIECSVHEVWSSILGGVNQDYFYTSNQNSVCTKGCLKPVEGIKSFNFFQNRMSVL